MTNILTQTKWFVSLSELIRLIISTDKSQRISQFRNSQSSRRDYMSPIIILIFSKTHMNHAQYVLV